MCLLPRNIERRNGPGQKGIGGRHADRVAAGLNRAASTAALIGTSGKAAVSRVSVAIAFSYVRESVRVAKGRRAGWPDTVRRGAGARTSRRAQLARLRPWPAPPKPCREP
jgi:hypothetical protein